MKIKKWKFVVALIYILISTILFNLKLIWNYWIQRNLEYRVGEDILMFSLICLLSFLVTQHYFEKTTMKRKTFNE